MGTTQKIRNIITVSGVTGSGKTSIVRKFLEMNPDAKMIKSYTSRGSRESDLLGEYEYNVSNEYFKKHKDEFLWTAQAHGNTYGTKLSSILEALLEPVPHVMILVPQVLEFIRGMIIRLSSSEQILSFYILSPDKTELRRRLSARKDDQVATWKRLIDAKNAKENDSMALKSDIPYIFLTNDEPGIGPTLVAQEISEFI